MAITTRNPVIAVDVDLTVTDVSLDWQDYLQFKYQYKDLAGFLEDCNDHCMEYDLSKYFNINHGDPFDFWRKTDLYDSSVCDVHAKTVLKALYDAGWDIVFVSWCYDQGQHQESKCQLLRREFDFIDKNDFHFITTKSKYLVKCDFAVDDRNSFLEQYDNDVTCFKINTPYTQDKELTRSVFAVDSWLEIYEILKKRCHVC